MKYPSPLLVALLAAVVVLGACGGRTAPTSPSDRTPSWVNALISQYEAAPVANPPRSIWRYQYRGETVYFVPPQCCDEYGKLFDEAGTQICYPNGGFTGHGDGRCPDFFQARTVEKLIWRDPRGHD